jgi:hypothetical protein
MQDGFFAPETNFGDANQNMEMHHGRRKSSDFDHHHPSYLNPSPDPHNLKNSIRYSENHLEVRDSGMMMSMAPPMLSVGGSGPSFDSGPGNYHINRPNHYQMPNLGDPSLYKPQSLK